uniref:Uncharacterized protein n=1 Tax=Anopheles farauti TaxID=69004 RepID=A0A182QXC5_9DIPT
MGLVLCGCTTNLWSDICNKQRLEYRFSIGASSLNCSDCNACSRSVRSLETDFDYSDGNIRILLSRLNTPLASVRTWTASGFTQVGIAFDHLPFLRHLSIFAPRNSRPASQVNVMLSPIE